MNETSFLYFLFVLVGIDLTGGQVAVCETKTWFLDTTLSESKHSSLCRGLVSPFWHSKTSAASENDILLAS